MEYKRETFFNLHAKFEELYNDAQVKVDMVAERILTLGGVPCHTFHDYNEHAKVPVEKVFRKIKRQLRLL